MTGQLGKDPSGVPPTDLSGLFGPATAAVPDRTAGVPRLAPPPVRPAGAPVVNVAPTSPAAPAPTVIVAPAASTEANPAPAGTAPTRRRRRSATVTKKHPSAVVIYLSVSLRTRLRAHATSTGRPHTQVVFDALNATHDRLVELAAGVGHVEQPVDGLFIVQPATRRVHTEDQVQVSIRPNPANLAVIDQLAVTHTAGNRSALITLALHHFLPTTSVETL